jgi:SAM-dependent methyltransferase
MTFPRRDSTREFFERAAPERDRWIDRNIVFHQNDWRYMQFLIPAGLRVLDLGCGTGRLLASLRPAVGVGIDISPGMVDIARRNFPALSFQVGDIEDPGTLDAISGPFDAIILSDTVGHLGDCQALLERLHHLCTPETRIVIAYYNQLWRPILWLAEKLRSKMREPASNWLSINDLGGLLHLADFEVIKRERRQLLPRRFLGAGHLVNAYVGSLPGIRNLCLRNYVVARPLLNMARQGLSASVLVPCRNERGNIEAAVTRLPRFCEKLEILFVEGHSRDGTYDECLRVQAAYPQYDIKVLRQDGKGKGDAVRKGFAAATGDILIILDADLTVPPEAIPKFYDVLASGKGEFVNGTRLVYPMESGAMRLLNYLANRAFAIIFSWLLNQRFTDTLCGTKVLTKAHYRRIEAGRNYFGEFDPFGDFDLIFGAAKINLKIVEIPVRYADRMYGTTQISRFRHGWLLMRMVIFAFRKLKAI